MTTPTDTPSNAPPDAPDAAAEIYQSFLDETSGALMRGDSEAFCRRMALPFVMRTSEGETVLETWDELMEDSLGVVQAMRDVQLTDFIRVVRKARFLNATTIEGWHTTYALRNAATMTPPYDNRLVFRQENDTWKVALAEHEVRGVGGMPMSFLRGEPGVFAATWADAQAAAPETPARAAPIYAAFLSSLDATNHANDFEAWQAHYAFPLAFHLQDTDHAFARGEDFRDAMFTYQNQMEVNGAPARIQRRVKRAEFLQDNRILGYHDAYWIQDGRDVLGPMPSRMILREHAGRLQAVDVTNALPEALLATGKFEAYGALPTLREIERRNRDLRG